MLPVWNIWRLYLHEAALVLLIYLSIGHTYIASVRTMTGLGEAVATRLLACARR